MEKHEDENETILASEEQTRLVRDNQFRIRRYNIGGFLFARDMYHTLLSLHSVIIFGILILMYV
jgi:hypothetical protein